MLPNTVDGIALDVWEKMDQKSKDYIATECPSAKDMGKFHFFTGMNIRNHYKLWDKNHPLTKPWFDAAEKMDRSYIRNGVDYHPNHPDAISGEILRRIWEINDTSRRTSR